MEIGENRSSGLTPMRAFSSLLFQFFHICHPKTETRLQSFHFRWISMEHFLKDGTSYEKSLQSYFLLIWVAFTQIVLIDSKNYSKPFTTPLVKHVVRIAYSSSELNPLLSLGMSSEVNNSAVFLITWELFCSLLMTLALLDLS